MTYKRALSTLLFRNLCLACRDSFTISMRDSIYSAVLIDIKDISRSIDVNTLVGAILANQNEVPF
jgi:hypothetical protein